MILLKTICPNCGKVTSIQVDAEAYFKYRQGGLIQNCFPDMPSEQREQLVSGICPECWNKMFPEDEEL